MIPFYTPESFEAALPPLPDDASRRPCSIENVVLLHGTRPAIFNRPGLPDMNAAAQSGLSQGFGSLPPERMDDMVGAMLRCLPHVALGSRKPWLDVLFACADAERLGAGKARALAEDWSRPYPAFDQAAFDTAWDSFRPGGIGIGTLIHTAKAVGFDASPWLRDLANPTVVAQPCPRASSTVSTFFQPIPTTGLHAPPFVVDGLALAGDVTVIAGAGGVAKTATTLHLAVAIAAGLSSWGSLKINARADRRPHRVAYVAAEEDANRIGLLKEAACVALGLSAQERTNVTTNLMLHDARASGFRIGTPRAGEREIVAPEEHDAWAGRLRDALHADDVSVLILDTLAALFAIPNEIDNSVMTTLIGRVTRIAAATGCAVILLHHTPKLTREATAAQRGEATVVRGGGAITASARVVVTLTGLPLVEAAQFAMVGSNPDSIRRIDWVKINDRAPPAPILFEVDGVRVPTVDGANPSIRTIRFIAAPQSGTSATPTWALNTAMKVVDVGWVVQGVRQPLSRAPQSNRPAYKAIAHALTAANPRLSRAHAEAEAKRVLKELMDRGCVIESTVTVAKSGGKGGGNSRNGLETRWHLASWAPQPAAAAAASPTSGIASPPAPPQPAAPPTQPAPLPPP